MVKIRILPWGSPLGLNINFIDARWVFQGFPKFKDTKQKVNCIVGASFGDAQGNINVGTLALFKGFKAKRKLDRWVFTVAIVIPWRILPRDKASSKGFPEDLLEA